MGNIVRAGNADVWLIGRPRERGGFDVRYVSWSLSYAHEIVRDGEQIRRGVVMVVNIGPARGPPRKVEDGRGVTDAAAVECEHGAAAAGVGGDSAVAG